jgi:hypothetical protein
MTVIYSSASRLMNALMSDGVKKCRRDVMSKKEVPGEDCCQHASNLKRPTKDR